MNTTGLVSLLSKNSNISLVGASLSTTCSSGYNYFYLDHTNFDGSKNNFLNSNTVNAFITNNSKVYFEDYNLSKYRFVTEKNSFVNFPDPTTWVNYPSSHISGDIKVKTRTSINGNITTSDYNILPKCNYLVNDGNVFYWSSHKNDINRVSLSKCIDEFNINFGEEAYGDYLNRGTRTLNNEPCLSSIPKDLHGITLKCTFNKTSGHIAFNNFFNGKIICDGTYYANCANSSGNLVFNNCENVELSGLSAISMYNTNGNRLDPAVAPFLASTSIVQFNNVKYCNVVCSFFSLSSLNSAGFYGEDVPDTYDNQFKVNALTGGVSLYNYKNLEDDNVYPSTSFRQLPRYITFKNSVGHIQSSVFEDNHKISIVITQNSTVASHDNIFKNSWTIGNPDLNKDYFGVYHYVTKNSILNEYDNTYENNARHHEKTYNTMGSICNHYHKEHINPKQENYFETCVRNDLPIGTFIECVNTLPVISTRTPFNKDSFAVYNYFDYKATGKLPFNLTSQENRVKMSNLSVLYDLPVKKKIYIPNTAYKLNSKYCEDLAAIQFFNGRFEFSSQYTNNEYSSGKDIKISLPTQNPFFGKFFANGNSDLNPIVKYAEYTYINNKDRIYGILSTTIGEGEQARVVSTSIPIQANHASFDN